MIQIKIFRGSLTTIEDELNIFLRQHGVDGDVQEVRLVHILGH